MQVGWRFCKVLFFSNLLMPHQGELRSSCALPLLLNRKQTSSDLLVLSFVNDAPRQLSGAVKGIPQLQYQETQTASQVLVGGAKNFQQFGMICLRTKANTPGPSDLTLPPISSCSNMQNKSWEGHLYFAFV